MIIFYLSLINEEYQSKFEEIYNSYRKQMLLLANNILNNKTDAEDAVHEVFLNIAVKNMKTVMTISSKDDLRNYLLKATKNTALNILKRNNRIVSLDTELDSDTVSEKLTHDSFKETICERVDYDILLDAISKLDKKYCEVIYYHYVVGLTLQETANLLNRKVTTVKTQLIRGKRALYNILKIGDID